MFRALLFLLCIISLFGCESPSEEQKSLASPEQTQPQPFPAVEIKPLNLLEEPVEAVIVETAAEALPTWRKYAAAKPTLILMAQNPQLQQIPEAIRKEALQLSREGGLAKFQIKASPHNSSPTILPHMALSAALDSGLITKVIWVLPVKKEASFTLEAFRQQMLSIGDFSEEEAASFELKDGSFIGKAHGVPFQATPLHALKLPEGPLLLHLDLGFFPPLYSNEIKTPLHALVYATLKALRELKLPVAQVTLSRSNLSGDLPLRVRFLGDLIARLLQTPELLDKPLSTNDSRRNEALYLGNFFQKEEVLKLYQQMEDTNPKDASIKYDLYQTTRQFKQGDKALEYLAQAIAIDPLYALEYEDLATLALEKGRPDEAIRMLNLATRSFPDSPYILLSLAEINLNIGHTEKVKELVTDLRKFSWSDAYNPGMEDYLKKLSSAAEEDKKPDDVVR